MTEREQEIEQALQHLNANWNAQQTERASGGDGRVTGTGTAPVADLARTAPPPDRA